MISLKRLLSAKRGSVTAAAAGFTAFVNIYALQSLLPLLSESFSRESRQVSLAVSATALGVALASPLAGWLVSRMTRGNLTKLSVGGLVFCGLQVAASSSLESLIAWRFTQGLFLPILVAGVLSFMAQDFKAGELAKATSYYVTWTIVGGFAGRWIGGLVAASWGWRPALLVLALLNAAAGLILLSTLSNPKARLSKDRLPGLRDFWKSFSDPTLRACYLIGFATLFTMVGVFTFVTFHLAQAPFSLGPDDLGRLFCVYLLGIAITPMVGSLVKHRGISSTVRLACQLSFLGLGLSLLPKVGAVVLGLALICVAGFGTQAAVSSFLAQLEPQRKSVAASLYLGCYYFGGCLGAALPGYFWEFGAWPACVALLAVIQLGAMKMSGYLERNIS